MITMDNLKQFLKQVPRKESTARARAAKAFVMATQLGLIISYRKEGQEFPHGFFMYPPEDSYNLGAFLRDGAELTGWRWSLRIKKGTDWSGDLSRRTMK